MLVLDAQFDFYVKGSTQNQASAFATVVGEPIRLYFFT